MKEQWKMTASAGPLMRLILGICQFNFPKQFELTCSYIKHHVSIIVEIKFHWCNSKMNNHNIWVMLEFLRWAMLEFLRWAIIIILLFYLD